MLEFRSVKNSFDLPPGWDEIADNYFQQSQFLSHAEKFNPCHQRYYVGIEDGKLVCGAIVYTLRLDLFTFIRVKSPLRMHIVGVPCSVSGKGIFGHAHAVKDLKQYIYEAEKGFVLVLNLEEKPETSCASGHTLPTILFSNRFENWNAYISSLRSSYKRRLILINKENSDLRFEKKPCSKFTAEMYRQYLDVYNRSKGKLEKLTLDFFKNLPPEFKLTVCFKKETIIGWNIALSNQNVYYFFLGGVDYKQNRIYNTYLRLLTNIIKDGIENKAEIIELGQTAEIPKMRLGGKPRVLYMEARHSNKVINKLIKIGSPLLEYKRILGNTNAIKEEKK